MFKVNCCYFAFYDRLLEQDLSKISEVRELEWKV